MSESLQATITTPRTRWLLNSRHLFLTILETRSLRSEHEHGQVLVRTLFRVADFSFCPYMAEGARVLCGVSFIRALIPF